MITYNLHKISEGFIITSDEKIIKDDSFYNTIDEVVYHNAVGWEILNKHTENEDIDLKVIAQQDQIDFSALSYEEQKEIGYFNLNKFKTRQWNNYEPISNDISTENGFKDGLEIGFQKALELLSDRIFTLEDIEKAIHFGQMSEKESSIKLFEKRGLFKTEVTNKFIKSLSQKSWKIECVEENGKVKILKLL